MHSQSTRRSLSAKSLQQEHGETPGVAALFGIHMAQLYSPFAFISLLSLALPLISN